MGEFNHRLIIDPEKIKLIKQQDIYNYAKHLNWRDYRVLDSEDIVLNSPKKDELDQLIISKDTMHDIFQRTWDCIQKLAEYHNLPYVYVYDHIISWKDKEENGYDNGQNIKAVSEIGQAPDDVTIICKQYGKTMYYDISYENAERLGKQLIQCAQDSKDFYKAYEKYIEKENKK